MKYLKLFENYNLVKTYKSLLNNNGKFYYKVGSSSYSIDKPTDYTIENILIEMISHHFMDQNFMLNYVYGDDRNLIIKKFSKNFIQPYLFSYFNKFKEKYMELSKPYAEGKPIYWSIKKDFNDVKFFDEFMLESDFSEEIINKYIKYRKDYYNVDIS